MAFIGFFVFFFVAINVEATFIFGREKFIYNDGTTPEPASLMFGDTLRTKFMLDDFSQREIRRIGAERDNRRIPDDQYYDQIAPFIAEYELDYYNFPKALTIKGEHVAFSGDNDIYKQFILLASVLNESDLPALNLKKMIAKSFRKKGRLSFRHLDGHVAFSENGKLYLMHPRPIPSFFGDTTIIAKKNIEIGYKKELFLESLPQKWRDNEVPLTLTMEELRRDIEAAYTHVFLAQRDIQQFGFFVSNKIKGNIITASGKIIQFSIKIDVPLDMKEAYKKAIEMNNFEIQKDEQIGELPNVLRPNLQQQLVAKQPTAEENAPSTSKEEHKQQSQIPEAATDVGPSSRAGQQQSSSSSAGTVGTIINAGIGAGMAAAGGIAAGSSKLMMAGASGTASAVKNAGKTVSEVASKISTKPDGSTAGEALKSTVEETAKSSVKEKIKRKVAKKAEAELVGSASDGGSAMLANKAAQTAEIAKQTGDGVRKALQMRPINPEHLHQNGIGGFHIRNDDFDAEKKRTKIEFDGKIRFFYKEKYEPAEKERIELKIDGSLYFVPHKKYIFGQIDLGMEKKTMKFTAPSGWYFVP